MTEKTAKDLAWVRAELAKQPDRIRYNLLKNSETSILKKKMEEEFQEAAERSEKYKPFREVLDVVYMFGYTELCPPQIHQHRFKKV